MKLTGGLTRLMTAVIFLSILIINSCKKETSNSGNLTPQEEEQATLVMTESDAEAEFVFNDLFDDVMGANNDVGMAGTGIFGRANSLNNSLEIARVDSTTRCFTVAITHVTTSFFPVSITIDFGSGCLGRDGHTRYGKIITTYTDRLIVPGASATTSLENFKIDSLQIAGTQKVTNSSTANERQFSVDVENAKLSKPNGNYSEWNSHKTITQVEGLGTPELPFDDIYKIQGSATGKVKNGDRLYAWGSDIVDPLIKKFTCPWIVKGQVKNSKVSNSSNSTWVAVLDYGNGDCDNQATITINGIEHQITLH